MRLSFSLYFHMIASSFPLLFRVANQSTQPLVGWVEGLSKQLIELSWSWLSWFNEIQPAYIKLSSVLAWCWPLRKALAAPKSVAYCPSCLPASFASNYHQSWHGALTVLPTFLLTFQPYLLLCLFICRLLTSRIRVSRHRQYGMLK
jgi:hypothetical protein